MKIKIVKSPSFFGCEDFYLFPPLGMAQIYAFLSERGHDITQEDLHMADYSRARHFKNKSKLAALSLNKKRLIDYLEGKDDVEIDNIVLSYLCVDSLMGVDVLLISINSLDTVSSLLSLLIARHFKHSRGGGIVIMGGEGWGRECVHEKFKLYNGFGIIDYYIIGPGELPLDMLLKKIGGADIKLENIPGLFYTDGGNTLSNGKPAESILLLPSFQGLPMEKYSWKASPFFTKISENIFSREDILVLPVQNTLGCPNGCAFCSHAENGVNCLEPGEIVRNVAILAREHRTKYFFFADSMINVSKKFITDFCDEIIKTKLEICWSACASFRGLDNPEIFKLMRQAGACRLIFGLETASSKLLHFIKKGVSVECAERCLGWSHDAGIWTELEIIAGLPHENDGDICATSRFLRDNRRHINGVWLNKFFLASGSPMQRRPGDYGISNIKDYDNSRDVLQVRDKRVYYSFDEVDGLEWGRKKRQIDRSYAIVLKYLLDNDLHANSCANEQLNVLFYLYSNLSDMKDIVSYFNRYQHNTKPLFQKMRLFAKRIQLATAGIG